MTTHEVAELLHINKQTILYYEKEGLLLPKRNENGYRDYREEDIDTLKLIQTLRLMECSIEEIRKILSHQESIQEVLKEKQEFLKQKRIEIDDIERKIYDFIKRRKVKVSFDNQYLDKWSNFEDTLFFNRDHLKYQNNIISLTDIKSVSLSMCSSLNYLRFPFAQLNYYVDLDIDTNNDSYSFQIMNNDHVAKMFQYMIDQDFIIHDPLGLLPIYLEKNDLIEINRYINLRFRKWAKQYHLDNPRESLFDTIRKK